MKKLHELQLFFENILKDTIFLILGIFKHLSGNEYFEKRKDRSSLYFSNIIYIVWRKKP